ncbi:MAG: hypothetical protein AAFO07_09475 [Bacteroidota bacterium]
MSIQNLTIEWNNIVINITYNNNWSKAYQNIYGYGMGFIEIQSLNREPLPITNTGYRSIFCPTPEIESWGDLKEYFTAQLNEAAKSRAWKAYERSSRQLTLF